MWAGRVDEGYVFGGLSATCVDTLKGVPMLIESNDDRVRERLLPETCVEHGDEQHWREHAVPELERLFASRAQLVRRDLAGMRKLGKSDSQLLLIPNSHVNAWLAALNAARLALFVLNDLEAKHLDVDGFAIATQKQQEAMLRIHVLAEMQSVLLGDYEMQSGGSIAALDPDRVDAAADEAPFDDDPDGDAPDGDAPDGDDPDGDDPDGDDPDGDDPDGDAPPETPVR